jgi:hypothetical protein
MEGWLLGQPFFMGSCFVVLVFGSSSGASTKPILSPFLKTQKSKYSANGSITLLKPPVIKFLKKCEVGKFILGLLISVLLTSHLPKRGCF